MPRTERPKALLLLCVHRERHGPTEKLKVVCDAGGGVQRGAGCGLFHFLSVWEVCFCFCFPVDQGVGNATVSRTRLSAEMQIISIFNGFGQ